MSNSPYQRRQGGKDFRPRVQAIDVAGRVPPHNEEAEAAVLSAVLTDGRALDGVLEILPNGEPFYSDAHRRIYDSCVELHGKGQPVDIQTVAAVLKDRERLQAVGGISYLVKIVDATPSVAHVAAHARIVREKWRVRKLIETCQMVAAEGYGDYGDAQEFIDGAEQQIYELARTPSSSTVHLMYDVVRNSFLQLQAAFERGKHVTGVGTGFNDLDEKTSGMHEGELSRRAPAWERRRTSSTSPPMSPR
jgi:replicative DNA helicase